MLCLLPDKLHPHSSSPCGGATFQPRVFSSPCTSAEVQHRSSIRHISGLRVSRVYSRGYSRGN